MGLLTPTAPPNVTSTGTSTTTLPTNITNYEGAAGQTAKNLLQQSYNYQGPLAAGPTTNQLGAATSAGGLAQANDPYAAQAGATAAQAPGVAGTQAGIANTYGALGAAAAYDPSNGWPAQAGNYMDPYTKNVVQGIADLGNQNFNTKLMPSINSQFIGAGDFDSLNNMSGLGQAAAETQQGITSAQSQALQTGYGQGLNAYLQKLQDQISAAGQGANAANTTGAMQTGALNNTASNLNTIGNSDVNNQAITGQNLYNVGETGVQAGIQNYQNTLNFPLTSLSQTSGAMSQLPWPGTVSGTSNAPLAGAQYGPSTLGTIGSVLGGLNYLGGAGGSNLYKNLTNLASGAAGGLNSAYNWLTSGSNSTPATTDPTAVDTSSTGWDNFLSSNV